MEKADPKALDPISMDTWSNDAPSERSRYLLVWETLNKGASGTIIVMLKLHRNWETRPRASARMASQEVGGTLMEDNELVMMAGAELEEWYQMCLMTFHLLRSGHYCEPLSPQQSPVDDILALSVGVQKHRNFKERTETL
jgi:hypothetical protein